ncbi:glycoside hydrolase family 3 C-terminal domain-containing protein [Actinoplanes sp. NPDC051411]|uniref:glycoside hydrolase family 3 protein n=1 Tax=Actinoplanes sp. NPDC051411 TaxID=3155522 RepID=UPI00342C00D8
MPFADALARVRAGADPGKEAEALLAELTPEEKLWLLDGDDDFWPGLAEMSAGYNLRPILMGAVDRLGIPGLRFSDGPRGVVMGQSTAFPVSMARGATWDVTLEERVGLAIGREMRAQGANFFGGVCINLPRHPAWGRIQETYGEDPLLLGEFGAALVRGVHRNAMAVAKHYALNSMENARFTVDVRASDETLHEAFLPHFRRVVEEGVDGIMTSYNSVNGEWAGQNAVLMEEILRGRWGFEGVTVSDFIWGLRDPGKSLRNGLDVEEPFRQQRASQLPALLESGEASWDDVDRAGRRILRTQLAFYASDLEDEPSPSVVFSAEHRELAREVSRASIVLLKNESVLPLKASELSSIAVVGRLADVPNTGDHGSSDVRSPAVTTALQGLSAALPGVRVKRATEDGAQAAAEAARDADAAIVVVGYTAADEGEYVGDDATADPALLALYPPAPSAEDPSMANGVMVGAMGGDRASLRLRPADVELIRAVAAVNPRTVVVIVTAGAVITEEWRSSVPAVLIGWYGGVSGGQALADVLLGECDASGRLPYSIPADESHLPFFDRDATSIVYDKWFGQRLLDRDGVEAAFPLGFGLSYTSFAISSVSVSAVADESFTATVDVSNTGSRDGRHVVQLYGVVSADDFPRRVLLGFAPVSLPAGSSATITVRGSVRPLLRWTGVGFTPAATEVVVEAAGYSGDPAAATVPLHL